MSTTVSVSSQSAVRRIDFSIPSDLKEKFHFSVTSVAYVGGNGIIQDAAYLSYRNRSLLNALTRSSVFRSFNKQKRNKCFMTQ